MDSNPQASGGTSLLRRVGILGDVHAEEKTLAAALAFLRGLPDLDALLCTGDIPGDAGGIDRCCALLKDAGVLTVRGNHDRWHFDASVPYGTNDYPNAQVGPAGTAYLVSLPPTREFQTLGGPLLLCHGLGRDDMAGVYPDDQGYALEANHRLHALVGEDRWRYVVNGHTHRRMVRTFDGLTVINAGTLQWAHEPCFCVADFAHRTVQYYDIDPDTLTITQAQTIPLPAKESLKCPSP